MKSSRYDRNSSSGISIVCATILLLISLPFNGCDSLDKNTRTTSPEPQSLTAPKKPPTPASISPEQIELFDVTMQRLDQTALAGDLRPFWKVSGRIRNNSREYLGSLLLRIYVTERGRTQIQDEANLHLETDISAGSVGSFSRQIQLLPPQKAWSWTYEVVEAHAKAQ